MKAVVVNVPFEELKKWPIEYLEKIDRECLKDIPYLKLHGFNKIGDLFSCNTSEKKEALKEIEFWKHHEFLRQKFMYDGIITDEDKCKFNEAGMTKELAIMPIDKLQLPLERKIEILNCLKGEGIFFLGDLVTTSYLRLVSLSEMDGRCISDLKKCIHSLGYSFKDEKTTIIEARENLKNQGMTLLNERLPISKFFLSRLENAGIYTIEQLSSCDFKVIYDLFDRHYKSIQSLVRAMASCGLFFKEWILIKKKDKEKMLSMPIEVLILCGLSEYAARSFTKLEQNGIKTIGNLIKENANYIYKILKMENCDSHYFAFRETLINMGLLFESDISKFAIAKISEEVGSIPICCLNISKALMNILSRNGFYCLGDILYSDYSSLAKLYGMGEKIVELKIIVHNMGYVIPHEYLTKKEEQLKREQEGIKEASKVLGLSNYLSGVLAFYGIVTIEDLLAKVPNIFYIERMGPKTRKELKDAMRRYGLIFDDPYENNEECLDSTNKETYLKIQSLLKEIEKLSQEENDCKNRRAYLKSVIAQKREELRGMRRKVKKLTL